MTIESRSQMPTDFDGIIPPVVLDNDDAVDVIRTEFATTLGNTHLEGVSREELICALADLPSLNSVIDFDFEKIESVLTGWVALGLKACLDRLEPVNIEAASKAYDELRADIMLAQPHRLPVVTEYSFDNKWKNTQAISLSSTMKDIKKTLLKFLYGTQ